MRTRLRKAMAGSHDLSRRERSDDCHDQRSRSDEPASHAELKDATQFPQSCWLEPEPRQILGLTLLKYPSQAYCAAEGCRRKRPGGGAGMFHRTHGRIPFPFADRLPAVRCITFR